MLPAFVLGPLAGVLADRMDRRTLLIVADLGRAVTVLGFLAVGTADTVWIVYPLTLVQFTFAALFDPARNALIPAVTRADERVTANALGALTWSALLAVGAALGGLATGLVGPGVAFVIDALSFAGSAALVAGIPRAATRAYAGDCGRAQPIADFRAGVRYLRERPTVFGL